MNPRVLEAAARAMQKAAEFRSHTKAWWEVDPWHWRVASRTTGEVYHITHAQGSWADSAPWWEAWTCTCPASHAGYKVCWHKAVVKLRINDGIMVQEPLPLT